MEKIKILVACHKPGPVYQDDVYTPIHVGRAISKYKDEMAEMIGDDTGENISEKNPYYCEMTAQYWAWKNLKDVEYVGFCHYRRYFDLQITKENADAIFRKKDVILMSSPQLITIERFLLCMVSREEVTIFMMALKKLYPEYEQTTLDYLFGNQLYSNNMLICRKSLFDDYASWMFSILKECEKYMRPSAYTRGRRALAYLAEIFMPVYFLQHQLRIKTARITPWYGEKSKKCSIWGWAFLKSHHFLMSCLMNKPKSFADYYYDAVMIGLKADGILDEIEKDEK